jgi:hypothetical protein
MFAVLLCSVTSQSFMLLVFVQVPIVVVLFVVYFCYDQHVCEVTRCWVFFCAARETQLWKTHCVDPREVKTRKNQCKTKIESAFYSLIRIRPSQVWVSEVVRCSHQRWYQFTAHLTFSSVLLANVFLPRLSNSSTVIGWWNSSGVSL